MICPYCRQETIPVSVAEKYLKKHISARHKKEHAGLKVWVKKGYRGK